MTTIAVVRKNGYAAIAADTLTKWGSGKESAAYIANNTKIVKAGDSFLAASGTATFKLILRDYFSQRGTVPRFDTTINIFKTWLKTRVQWMQGCLKLPDPMVCPG